MALPSKRPARLLFVAALFCLVRPLEVRGDFRILGHEKLPHGALFRCAAGGLRIQLWADNVVRVSAWPGDAVPGFKSLTVIQPGPDPVRFKMREAKDRWRLETAELCVEVLKSTGAVRFLDRSGSPILVEPREGGKALTPAVVDGEPCVNAEQRFAWRPEESLYGLGQHQSGLMNYRGHDVLLVQDNTVDVVPVLTSSRGWGLLWDNASMTEFRDSAAKRTASADGPDCGSLWSEVADGIDYYFLYGPALDRVIASYRNLTGPAPLFGRWAYGLWQCKEHYHTQAEVEGVVAEYRRRGVPLDNIVQDWYYWEPSPWGSHAFDRARYPDPTAMVRNVHAQNARIMISVWAKFDSGSANARELETGGFLYPATGVFGRSRYYDAFDPAARAVYWRQMRDSLFSRGIDAWWLDATEPEMGDLRDPAVRSAMKNRLGTGARFLNAYSLMTTEAVYRGQREESEKQRVFLLTRSAFAGQQRNAAASWSGDIEATWEVFRRQIPGGLNLGLSGLPYWTTDIGAFFVTDYAGGNQNPEYQELFTRWFQFGAFCPVFRVHGTSTPREIYRFGEPGHWAYDTQLAFDRLRYRLMPYHYSVAWKTTSEGYTPMRGLAFDFPDDAAARDAADQYLYGPAFLVNPVTEPLYHKDFTNLTHRAALVPADRLRTPGGAPGLAAAYHRGENFETPLLERADPAVDFSWGVGTPDPAVPADDFSVRWTGTVTPAESGETVFATQADDGVRLWVDGRLLIEDWTQHGPEYRTGRIRLEAGKPVPLTLEYFERIGGASVRLLWIPASREAELEKLRAEADSGRVKTRRVALPGRAGWTDFWTGRMLAGGRTVDAEAPIGILPLYVRSGAIVPMGPHLQYADEKPADPLELRVYPGADGDFTLYEDENDNYGYEKGAFATIRLRWDDRRRELSVGGRDGSFPGMQAERTFNVVLVREGHGAGIEPAPDPDRVVRYDGRPLRIRF